MTVLILLFIFTTPPLLIFLIKIIKEIWIKRENLLCNDCRYYLEKHVDKKHICKRVVSNKCKVTGEILYEYRCCFKERASGDCGKIAIYFEKKENKK